MTEQEKTAPPPEGKEQKARSTEEARRISARGTNFERFRRHFLAGIFVIIPAFVAAYAVIFIMNLAENIFGPTVLAMFGLDEGDPRAEKLAWQTLIKLISFVLAVVFVVGVGYLSTFFLVRRAIMAGENIVGRLPLIKFFYNTPKEVLNTFTARRRSAFKRVVMVEYPRRGMWCLAFATGEVVRRPENQRLIAIFLPTTPNPTSGFLIFVNADEVYDTNIPVEQGARMIISAGILTPDELCTQQFSDWDRPPVLPPLGPVATEPHPLERIQREETTTIPPPQPAAAGKNNPGD